MRRLALLLLALLLCPVPAWAQVSISQEPAKESSAYDGSNQKTFAGLTALSVGDFVVCGAINEGNRTFSSATLGGQAMTVATALNNVFERQVIYYRYVTGAESGEDVVVTISGSDGTPSPMACIVATGVASDQSSLDGTSTSSTGTSVSVGPVTPDTAHNLVVGWAGSRANRTWTNAAGWTQVGTPANTNDFVYDIQTAADARQWDITADSSGYTLLSIAAFNGSAAASTCTGGLTLFGAGKC